MALETSSIFYLLHTSFKQLTSQSLIHHIGLAYGISLGFRETSNDTTLTGSMGLIFGLNVVSFLPIVYLNFYLNAETDSYKALNFAGVPNALGVMMLTWIIFFTMHHGDEEKAMGNAVLLTVVKAVVGGEEGEADVAAPEPIAEESEF